jgi:hypothetical protein
VRTANHTLAWAMMKGAVGEGGILIGPCASSLMSSWCGHSRVYKTRVGLDRTAGSLVVNGRTAQVGVRHRVGTCRLDTSPTEASCGLSVPSPTPSGTTQQISVNSRCSISVRQVVLEKRVRAIGSRARVTGVTVAGMYRMPAMRLGLNDSRGVLWSDKSMFQVLALGVRQPMSQTFHRESTAVSERPYAYELSEWGAESCVLEPVEVTAT